MEIVTLITDFGFPIACVVGLAFFSYKMTQQVRDDAKEDKEKLYKIVAETQQTLKDTREVNINVTKTNEKLVDTVTQELKSVNTKLDVLIDKKTE